MEDCGISDPGQRSGQDPGFLDSEETGGYRLDVCSDLRVSENIEGTCCVN